MRAAAAGLARVVYRAEVVGRDRVPAGGAILVANHESVIDPFLLGRVTARPIRFLAKAELWDRRAVAWWMEALGGVAVERGRGDRDALARLEALLRDGWLVALFPQGTVNAGGPWHRGAAKLALATGAPLVPIRIEGSGSAVGGGRIGFPRIRLVVGEPLRVEPARATVASARALTEQIADAIRAAR